MLYEAKDLYILKCCVLIYNSNTLFILEISCLEKSSHCNILKGKSLEILARGTTETCLAIEHFQENKTLFHWKDLK